MRITCPIHIRHDSNCKLCQSDLEQELPKLEEISPPYGICLDCGEFPWINDWIKICSRCDERNYEF